MLRWIVRGRLLRNSFWFDSPPLKDKITGKTASGVGKDGYSIPLALTNRVQVLAKAYAPKKYEDVIWETAVPRYKTLDGESRSIVSMVKTYAFDYNYTKPIYAEPSVRYGKIHIKGTPPVKIGDK